MICTQFRAACIHLCIPESLPECPSAKAHMINCPRAMTWGTHVFMSA